MLLIDLIDNRVRLDVGSEILSYSLIVIEKLVRMHFPVALQSNTQPWPFPVKDIIQMPGTSHLFVSHTICHWTTAADLKPQPMHLITSR